MLHCVFVLFICMQSCAKALWPRMQMFWLHFKSLYTTGRALACFVVVLLKFESYCKCLIHFEDRNWSIYHSITFPLLNHHSSSLIHTHDGIQLTDTVWFHTIVAQIDLHQFHHLPFHDSQPFTNFTEAHLCKSQLIIQVSIYHFEEHKGPTSGEHGRELLASLFPFWHYLHF